MQRRGGKEVEGKGGERGEGGGRVSMRGSSSGR